MKQDFISVCLLTYNRADQLQTTISSLLVQTHQNFELIINDNCSIDHTESVCVEYARRDSRIKYFKNERNVGFAGNQNLAIERAGSEFIAIVHDGDFYHPELLEKWLRALMENPDCALVFNGYHYLSTKRTIVLPLAAKCKGLHMWELYYMLGASPIWGIVMVRRSKVLEIGRFDPEIPTLADVDMWLRLELKNNIAYIPEPLISLAGREPNHPARPWNWNVAEEEDRILWLNLARRFTLGSQERASLERHVTVVIWRRNIMNMLWTARKGKILSLFKGVLHFASYRKRRATLLSSIDELNKEVPHS